jgi:hypothetical protein
MLERFRRSWRLAKASYGVLRTDRELLVFPLVSFLALIVVSIGIAIPFALAGGTRDLESGRVSPVSVALGFMFYVVSYSVIFFFNTGLVGAAMIRLNGGDPTVRDGFRIASSHLPAIIGYAVVAATVGMVLRAIAERAGFIGQIVIGIIGFAWSVATFLVVPVLVVEGVGPLQAIKRSATLLRTTWGEQLIGGAGIGLVFGLITMGIIVLGLVLMVALASVSFALVALAFVALVLAVGAVSLIGAALSGIFTASLYRYATTGDAGVFGSDVMTAAFKQKAAGVGGVLGRTR